MKKYCLGLILFVLSLIFLPFNGILFAEEKDLVNYNLTEYKQFNIISETEFYCVNTTTKKIEHYNNGQVTNHGEYGINEGQFTDVKFFKKLQDGDFCLLDSLNKLHYFDINFNYIKTIQTTLDNNSYYPLGTVTQIITDLYSNVYLLDTTNNYILKSNTNSNYFEILTKTDLTNIKATILNNSNNFVFLQNEKLKYQNLEISLSSTPSHIFSDALEFIYLVYDNKIEKYNSNLTLIDSLDITFSSEFSLNLESGTIYYFIDGKILKIENFASNIENYTPPIDYTEKSSLTNEATFVKIKSDANLLKTPYSSTSLIKLNKDDILLKLSTTTEMSSNFAYVLYEKGNDIFIGYIEESFLSPKSFDETNISVSPVRDDINVYKYPISNLKENIKLSTLNEKSNYKQTRIITINNCNFAELKINDSYYYAKECELIDSSLCYINTYLTPNASLNFYNTNSINVYDNLNKDLIVHTFNKNQNIKVIETHDKMVEIEFIAENRIIHGYIESKYIANNNSFILPLTIILTLVSLLILTIILLKFKKDKNKKINI